MAPDPVRTNKSSDQTEKHKNTRNLCFRWENVFNLPILFLSKIAKDNHQLQRFNKLFFCKRHIINSKIKIQCSKIIQTYEKRRLIYSRAPIIWTSKVLTVDRYLSQAEKIRLVRRMMIDAIVTNRILQHVWVCAWQACRDRERFQWRRSSIKTKTIKCYRQVKTLSGKYEWRQVKLRQQKIGRRMDLVPINPDY